MGRLARRIRAHWRKRHRKREAVRTLMVKAEQKSQLTDLALVDLVAAVPQAAKAVLVDDKEADEITIK